METNGQTDADAHRPLVTESRNGLGRHVGARKYLFAMRGGVARASACACQSLVGPPCSGLEDDRCMHDMAPRLDVVQDKKKKERCLWASGVRGVRADKLWPGRLAFSGRESGGRWCISCCWVVHWCAAPGHVAVAASGVRNGRMVPGTARCGWVHACCERSAARG